MKLKDTVTIKYKDQVLEQLVYLSSTQTQDLFSKEEYLVGPDQEAVLWIGEVGVTSFYTMRKGHDYRQIAENEWEWDIEPLESL